MDWRSNLITYKKPILGLVLAIGILGAATLGGAIFSQPGPTQNLENTENTEQSLPAFSLTLFNLPNESLILFPPGDSDLVAVNFTSGNLTEVRLYLNDVNYGAISPNVPVRVPYSAAIDGPVILELRGFYNETQVITERRNVTFGKVISCTLGPTIDEGIIDVPPQLYAILHDPAGDHSNTYLNISRNEYNVALASSSGAIGTPTVDFSLCPEEAVPLQSSDYEWQYPWHSYDMGLWSSTEEEDRNAIGPGLGDSYYGCSWVLEWQLCYELIKYFNGTDTSTLRLFYGLRLNESISVGAPYCPPAWEAANPLYQPESEINWDKKLYMSARGSYSRSRSPVHLPMVYQSFTIAVSESARQTYPDLPPSIPLSLKTNLNGAITTKFTLFDDDAGDFFVLYYGFDPVYGTWIFSCVGDETRTSSPHEIGTVDWTALYFGGEPTVNYDTNGDGLPCRPQDTPLVRVEVMEDSILASVQLVYSTNNGTSWATVDMYPDADAPGWWEGSLPGQPQGTKVQWYIRATNEQGMSSELWDLGGSVPYTYTVQNSAPSVIITALNGGETLQGKFLVTWTATYPDLDSLTFNLAYNVGDTGWVSIATGVTGSSYLWNTSAIGSASLVSFRIRCYDGHGDFAESISKTTFVIIPL